MNANHQGISIFVWNFCFDIQVGRPIATSGHLTSQKNSSRLSPSIVFYANERSSYLEEHFFQYKSQLKGSFGGIFVNSSGTTLFFLVSIAGLFSIDPRLEAKGILIYRLAYLTLRLQLPFAVFQHVCKLKLPEFIVFSLWLMMRFQQIVQ